MRRQLTAREWMLLGVLGIMLVISAYFLLFYNPVTTERDRCISETEACRMQIEVANVRIEEKHRMERELEALFATDGPHLSIPDYDNVKPVMFELNSILANAQDYSLSFSTVDSSPTIIRRSIAMTFTANSYDFAKMILQQLHDSDYRCMMDNVSISFEEDDANVSVSATIVFFEYHAQPQAASQEGET